MSRGTVEALEQVAQGLRELLACLSAEPQTRADYTKLSLAAALRELEDALAKEPLTQNKI